MVNRDKYDTIIDSLCLISSHYSEQGFEKSIQQIRTTKTSFDIKLMFVGHFNAGKSSLLNGLIGRPGFLKESQMPQTAVAAELAFDEAESAVAYRDDGGREPLTEDALREPNKYGHFEYRLPAPGLKQISDYTIVDTPGFDSGVEAHTKALASYIGVGSAYIVVVDQEKGGIDGTTLDFIEEISHYSRQIAVLINKCDKISSQTAQDVAASAKDALLSCGFPYEVYTISARDPDVCDKLVSIISKFDAQLAFDRAMERQIRTELTNVGSVLRLARQKLYLDTFDLDEEIHAYTCAGERLSEIFEKKRKEATGNFDSKAEDALAEIRSALIARADAVAEAMISGSQAGAEAIIIETVRPMMLSSIKSISVEQIDRVTSALDFTGIIKEGDQRTLLEVANSLAGNLKDLIEQGTFESRSSLEDEETDSKKTTYRAVAGIAALLTDFVAPWMEIVIILLPDIVTLLKGLFGESSSERVKREFINRVVPQICNKLYPQIRQSIESSTQQILTEYHGILDEKLDQIKATIAQAEAKRKQKVESFEAYKKHIDEDLTAVQALIQQMG